MERKRIAYLTHLFSYGGATISLLLMQKSLMEEDFERIIFVKNIVDNDFCNIFNKYSAKITPVKIRAIYNYQNGYSGLIKYFYIRIINYRAFVKNLVDLKIDILHINTTVFPHIHHFVKKYSNIKIVTHVREIIPKYGTGIVQKYMINQILKYSDAIIAISDNEAKYFDGHKFLAVIPNPFDFSQIEKIPNGKRNESELFIIGMVADFYQGKGHMDLLAALKIILSNNDELRSKIRFLIIGSKINSNKRIVNLINFVKCQKEYSNVILEYIRKNDLTNNVEIKPYTLNIISELRSLDIYVRPSISGDPWGRDIIEAMAMKIPIIATGTSDFYIKNNYNGYLVPAKTPKLLAERISDLLLDKEKRKIFSERSYEIVKEKCDSNQYGKKIANIYHQLLQ